MTYRHTPAAHPDPCPWVAQLTPEQRGARGEEFEHCYSWGDGCAWSCARKRADARDRRNEARREGPRVFPMPTGGNCGKFGWCRWCGGELEGKNAKRRGWHDGREDEPNCAYEYRLHTRLEDQYPFLVDRDGERCWDCGETPLKVIRGHLITHIDWGGGRATEYVGNWCQIEIKPALDVDHEIPLLDGRAQGAGRAQAVLRSREPPAPVLARPVLPPAEDRCGGHSPGSQQPDARRPLGAEAQDQEPGVRQEPPTPGERQRGATS